ncbi:hypothetical protein COLO4_13907 [Corchorus olitorius]|uniref:Uncharacterized protein n=1 Tax=Corchorus olitorius TaxID=93759 RepID=A0A1R3JUA6_9ROSI|nr:hypothetical protein COLO4_13907 [Corchorus olitorius]
MARATRPPRNGRSLQLHPCFGSGISDGTSDPVPGLDQKH